MKKFKFVIIEDHHLTRYGISNYVSANEDFECIGEFSDTRSILNSSFSGKPDIIILDLYLGKTAMDGEKSYESLKRKYPDCKIFAYTQYEGRGKVLYDLGFDGYMIKSENESLIDALISVLNGEKYFKKGKETNAIQSSFSDKSDSFLKNKKLTLREIEVAKYIVRDYSNREIGDILFITEGTVETHRKHIKEKLGVRNNRELKEVFKEDEGDAI